MRRNSMKLLISDVADAVPLSPQTIRRAERRGLITSERDVNGWRRYDPKVIAILKKLYAVGQPGKSEEDN